jgi:hypothetical protein
VYRSAIAGFIAGFLVPIFWGVMAFLLWGAPQDRFAELFWQVVYLTCPFWGIDNHSMILLPALTGVLYAGMAVILTLMIRAYKTIRHRRGTDH